MSDVRFQVPPKDYSQPYFSALLRDIRQLFISLQTPTTTTIGKLVFIPPPQGIPTSAYGQPVGTVYVDGDVLKMVLGETAYVSSLTMASDLGIVIATGH